MSLTPTEGAEVEEQTQTSVSHTPTAGNDGENQNMDISKTDNKEEGDSMANKDVPNTVVKEGNIVGTLFTISLTIFVAACWF